MRVVYPFVEKNRSQYKRDDILTEIESDIETETKDSNDLFTTMNSSDFGKIKEIIQQSLTDAEIDECELPKILVVGATSSGKSSLLENITKCHLFPRNKNLCTKCPVRIILNESKEETCIIEYTGKNKLDKKSITITLDEVERYITTYFDSLPDIIEEELIVKIYGKDYPNIEIYDLPGLVGYPEEQRIKTEQLTAKYLAEHNSIVLCTVPATEKAVVNHRSIGLIKEHSREKDTIIVLTMIDKIHEDDYDTNIFDRILQSDAEINSLNVSDCLGIQSRSHKDRISLEQNDKVELEYINKMSKLIDDCREFSHYTRNKNKFLQKLGIQNLLTILQHRYTTYVKRNWVPKMIQKMEDKIQTLIQHKKTIGHTFQVNEMKCFLDKFLFVKYTRHIKIGIANFVAEILENRPKKDEHIMCYQWWTYISTCIEDLYHETFANKCCASLIKSISIITEFSYEGTKINYVKMENYPIAIEHIKHSVKEFIVDRLSILKAELHILKYICYQYILEDRHNELFTCDIIYKFLISILIGSYFTMDVDENDILESAEISDRKKEITTHIKMIVDNVKLLRIISK